MLVDELVITIKAGNGGEGKVSFRKGKKSGPDGGNGGDGGNAWIVASSDLTLLNRLHGKDLVSAEDGGIGGREKCAGKRGEDLLLELPVGTQLVDLEKRDVFELKFVGDKRLICTGGKGGIGNYDLRSATNTAPRNRKPATSGQKRRLKITLRYIADYGLIGLPSAGKSSLLNELTDAKAKTAEYHFTTLTPNLGVLPNKKIIADIPGLIEGASTGKGLGIKFLKHIQKVSLLLHCISLDSQDVLKDYQTIRGELGKYDQELLEKDEVILLTKSDLVNVKDIKKAKTKLKKLKRKMLVTSIHDLDSIKSLLKIL